MHVTLLAAQSLDGFITQHQFPGSGFTSEADKSHFRAALSRFDCSIMGGETFRVSRELILSRLTSQRLRLVLTRDPAAFAKDARPGLLEFTQLGAPEMLAQLESRGYQRCALLGGAQLHSMFLEANLVDELWLTIEPVLFGQGTPFLSRKGEFRLSLFEQSHLSEDVLLLKYRTSKN